MSPLLFQLAIFALAAGAATCLLVGVRAVLGNRRDPLRGRMQRSVAAAGGATFMPDADDDEGDSLLVDALTKVSKLATPKDAQELAGIKAKLSYAGYRSERAVRTFLGSKIALAVVGAILMRLYESTRTQPLAQSTLYTLLAMTLGFYLPNLWLPGRINERQAAVNLGLPDAMDLLVTCVEAGLALDGAITRICSEIRLASPVLAEELSMVAMEMRAGLTRGEAFRRLSDRSGVEELKYLSSIMVQAELFGTSIAQALRVMGEGMRVRRTQKAEKNAASAGVKMMVPLIACIMPALFTVIMGPAVINIIRRLFPAMGG